jgi:hypothetical protein
VDVGCPLCSVGFSGDKAGGELGGRQWCVASPTLERDTVLCLM